MWEIMFKHWLAWKNVITKKKHINFSFFALNTIHKLTTPKFQSLVQISSYICSSTSPLGCPRRHLNLSITNTEHPPPSSSLLLLWPSLTQLMASPAFLLLRLKTWANFGITFSHTLPKSSPSVNPVGSAFRSYPESHHLYHVVSYQHLSHGLLH